MEKTANDSPAKNVDEYLRDLPADVRISLERVRQAIRSTAPTAEECISYRIPTYKYKGPLIHFAANETHCSFIVVGKNILKNLGKELQSFITTGTTIHFGPDKPLPETLVQKIVRMRIKENEENLVESKALK